MKNNNYNDISIYIFLLLCLFTSRANSNLLSVAKIPSSGGYMIFELYDDPSLIAECRGMNASGVLAKLEKGDIKIGYGSGCWTADINGYIHLFIKSFEDGIVRDSKIHNSNFTSQTFMKGNLSPKIKPKKTLLMPIEISDFITLFMLKPNEKPSWNIGEKTPIKWGLKRNRKKCGSDGGCKDGKARISIGGNELKNINNPVVWNISMMSSKYNSDGPDEMEVHPECDTVECSFSFDKSIANKDIDATKLCYAGSGSFNTAAYILTQNGKQLFVAYDTDVGSAGTSNTLRLRWNLISNEHLCADAKEAE